MYNNVGNSFIKSIRMSLWEIVCFLKKLRDICFDGCDKIFRVHLIVIKIRIIDIKKLSLI